MWMRNPQEDVRLLPGSFTGDLEHVRSCPRRSDLRKFNIKVAKFNRVLGFFHIGLHAVSLLRGNRCWRPVGLTQWRLSGDWGFLSDLGLLLRIFFGPRNLPLIWAGPTASAERAWASSASPSFSPPSLHMVVKVSPMPLSPEGTHHFMLKLPLLPLLELKFLFRPSETNFFTGRRRPSASLSEMKWKCTYSHWSQTPRSRLFLLLLPCRTFYHPFSRPYVHRLSRAPSPFLHPTQDPPSSPF